MFLTLEIWPKGQFSLLVEMFYNSKRRQGSGNQVSPAEYENQYYQRLESVWIIRGDSRNASLARIPEIGTCRSIASPCDKVD